MNTARHKRTACLLFLTLFFSACALSQAAAHRALPYSCPARCVPVSLFVREERLPAGVRHPLPPLEDGDILLTDCAHTFGWRHGHGALVVDGPNRLVLEAVTPGVPSKIRSADHWELYPHITVLRLREADPACRQEIARRAQDTLTGLPYRLTSGLLGSKYPSSPDGGQCAYLIWYAYRSFGWDLDSDGGRLVTVDDLQNSPLLEAVPLPTGSP